MAQSESVCEPCVAGYFADAYTVCTACSAGESSLDLALECTKCDVRSACLEGGACATGYADSFCSNCARRYFKVSRRCKACPDNNALVLTLFILVFLLFALVVLKAGSSSRQTSSITAYGGRLSQRVAVPISIFWIELQINLTFFDVDLGWPPFLLDAMYWLRTVLDFDFAAMAAPECAVQFESAGAAFFARQVIVAAGLPAFVVAIGLLYLLFNTAVALTSQHFWRAFAHLLLGLPREIANAAVISHSMSECRNVLWSVFV